MAKSLWMFSVILVWCFFHPTVLGSIQVRNATEFRPDEANEIEERIIGGTRAQEGMFPYAAALYFQGTYACTASIISQRTILTAAHCVVIDDELQQASDFFAMVGSVNRSSSQAVRVGFSNVVVHPKYNMTTYDYDVAFLTLIEELKFSPNIQKICLSREDTPFFGSFVRATTLGWGQVSRYSEEKPQILHYALVKLLPHITCQARYLLQVNERQICADGFGKTVCQGDSGGPLVQPHENSIVQIGVASFINSVLGCGSLIIAPGVYVRISAVLNWITETTNDNGICTL